MFYISSPYSVHASSDSPEHVALREKRYEYTLKATAKLMEEGYTVISPICHCHDMAVKLDMPKDFSFWKNLNEGWIKCSDALYVLTMPYWNESEGVLGEIKYARSIGLDVHFIECPDYSEEEIQ